MSKIFSLLALLLSTQLVVAQSEEYRLAAIPEGAKLLGFANLKGEMVIEPHFYQAFGFDPNGVTLGFLKNEQTYGTTSRGIQKQTVKPFVFFDENGNPLDPERSGTFHMVGQQFRFGKETRAFYDGIFVASTSERLTDRFGINYEGKVVTKTHYTWMSNFSQGFAVAKHRNSKFVIVRPNEDDTPIKGIEVVKSKSPSEGLAPVRDKSGKWGFINIEGAVVIPAKFKDVGNFWGGYCWARNDKDLVGFINNKGEWVIEPKFRKAKDLDPVSGMAMVVEKRDWCYVNLDGKVTYGEKKQKLFEYSDGLAVKRDPSTKKVGYIDANGEWVVKPTLEVGRRFLHGYAVAKKDNLFGLLDTQGNWVIEPKFAQLMDAYPVHSE